jgi:predicted methyltransferase
MHTNTQKKFLNPESILFLSGLKPNQTVSDLGAGSGFYALAAAKIVGANGEVHVVDIKEAALDHLASEARMRGYKNIKTYIADLDEPKIPSRIPAATSDMVVLANILHEVGNIKNLLAHAYSLLKTGGCLVVVDWNDQPSPIGPEASKRLHPAQIKKQIESSAFKFVKEVESDLYHFAMVFTK